MKEIKSTSQNRFKDKQVKQRATIQIEPIDELSEYSESESSDEQQYEDFGLLERDVDKIHKYQIENPKDKNLETNIEFLEGQNQIFMR